MRFFKSVGLVGILAILSACSLKPVNIMERLKSPTTAVVLIGSYGDIIWWRAETTDPNSNDYSFGERINFKTAKGIPQFNDVLAIPVTVGSDFTITQMQNASEKYKLKINPHWPTIKIEKEGIYYYGLIRATQGAGLSVKVQYIGGQPSKETLEYAHTLYPGVFEKLQPANF